jgi:protocatechuate 3,4-dioxygenase beta subunit
MNSLDTTRSRRHFLTTIGASAASVAIARLFEPGIFAEELEKRVRTPEIEEGPFYPDHLPRDTDNDLLVISDAITPAVGEVTHLSGRILNSSGDPVRNALIEIWQVDASGSYIHSRGTNRNTNKRDANFQGYGRFLTSSTGEYYFRTIKPVPYPGRTPHIHVKISARGREQLTTQFFVKGEAMNERDGVFRGVRDRAALDSVLADFEPIKNSKAGELSAKVDVVLGLTPEA